MATAVAWNEGEAQSILRRHAGREGALLPILHDFQATFGCVPPAAVRLIAGALNLTRAEVHGVVSFYHDLDRKSTRLNSSHSQQSRMPSSA